MIQKIETSYLQLLRILLLLLATAALVLCAVMGSQFFIQRSAEPKPVDETIKLSLDDYSASIKMYDPATPQAKTGDQAPAAKADPLFDEFLAAVNAFGKVANPDFNLTKDNVNSAYRTMEEDSNLGRDFLKQLTGMLKAATSKTEIVARIKVNPLNELNSLINHSKKEYKDKQSAIRAEKSRASDEAMATRAQANMSLYAAGAIFLVFAGTILLVVLLKIERNLRGIVPSTPEQKAVEPETIAI